MSAARWPSDATRGASWLPAKRRSPIRWGRPARPAARCGSARARSRPVTTVTARAAQSSGAANSIIGPGCLPVPLAQARASVLLVRHRGSTAQRVVNTGDLAKVGQSTNSLCSCMGWDGVWLGRRASVGPTAFPGQVVPVHRAPRKLAWFSALISAARAGAQRQLARSGLVHGWQRPLSSCRKVRGITCGQDRRRWPDGPRCSSSDLFRSPTTPLSAGRVGGTPLRLISCSPWH